MLQGTELSSKRAKELRKQMSLPEVLLWRYLRGSPGGLKFRKQHPAGHYILDFYCHQARTIIEIDGFAHDTGDRPSRDQRRDAWLASCGLKVIRIPAKEVLNDPGGVAESIITLCCAAPPPSALCAVTSPLGEPLRSP